MIIENFILTLTYLLASFMGTENVDDKYPPQPVAVMEVVEVVQEREELSINIIDKNYRNFSEIIEEYKGNVIYVDLWASWCRPCLAEFPAVKNLQKKLQGEPVVFLFLGVNDRKNNWKAAIDRYQVTGEHIFLSGRIETETMRRFNVRSIPRHIIIDQQGNVIDENAPRASNPATLQKINQLLGK